MPNANLAIDEIAKHKQHRKQIWTKRGLVLAVAKHVPCSCLDSLAASAKQMDGACMRIECRKGTPEKVAKVCKGCKEQTHCNAECQAKDWQVTWPFCGSFWSLHKLPSIRLTPFVCGERHKERCVGRKNKA